MINVKDELRRGGVAGLFQAIGMTEAGVEVFAASHGKDLRAAWASMGDPFVMAMVALGCGVSGVEVVEAFHGALRISLNERDGGPHRVASDVLTAVDVALGELGDGSAMEEALGRASKWMATAKDSGSSAKAWDAYAVVGATNCARAAMIVGCPKCGGEDHRADLLKAILDINFAIGYGRILYSEDVGRIPKGGSDGAKKAWSDGYTAGHFRDQIPVEMLLTGPTLVIPTVTPEGEIRRVRRPRGQA